MRRAALVLAALVAAAPACTRTRIELGRPLAPADAAAVVPGMSKASVLGLLGPPDHVETARGGSAFEYLYSRTAERALDVSAFQASFSWEEVRTHVDRLRVAFDARGIVRYVGIIRAE